MDARKYLAELVGTFILVVVGSMSIVAANMMNAPVLLVAPFGFGLALLAAIQAAGHVSGGHFNPAVTLGAFLDRRIDAMNAIGYVIAQVVGAIAASGVVLLFADQTAVRATASGFADGKAGVAVGTEILLTAIFLLVILTVTKRAPGQAAFAIPLTLMMIHFAGIPFSGASVNPARSLAPALIGGALDSSILVWIVGPLVGAAIGWAIYRALDDGLLPD
ncbi:MAG TPA: aquaporin [Candidatus Limnocylindrales bacterium]|nr:aquaporin [Candidatus Limnocylindrales bacterium]